MTGRPEGDVSRAVVMLARFGMSKPDIVRNLRCDPSLVHRALVRYGLHKASPYGTLRISGLNAEDQRWLMEEARRTGVRWQDLARALLSDAIAEARDGRR